MRRTARRAALAAAAVAILAVPVAGAAVDAAESLRLVDASDRLSGFTRRNGPRNAGGLAGAAWFDYDGDGRLDLFLPGNTGDDNALFRNLGGGRFTDVARAAGVANGRGNLGAIAGDIDNDGCPELFTTGAGGIELTPKEPPRLYRNNCDGTFTDIAARAGVRGTRTSGAAAFGDIDNDGFIDLFIASAGDFADRKDPNKLYRNNGDRTFTDISAPAGVEPNLGSVDAAFVDFDKDGWQDILTDDGNDGVINPLRSGSSFQPVPGRHRLYRNDGYLTFTDVSARTTFLDRGFWMATAWGDYDNDSDLDHFATSVGQIPLTDLPVDLGALGVSLDFPPPHGFWENVGDGRRFRLASLDVGLFGKKLGFGWGASFADFDNDGWEDLFFVGNYPGLAGFLHDAAFMGDTLGNPGYLFRNDGRRRLELVQTFGQQNQFTSGSAVADFDADGFPDVVVVNTAFGRDRGAPILLRNATANGNGWITVRTVGTRSNRDGIGARVRVLAGRLTKLKDVRAGSSFASMDSPWPTFGLGPAAASAVTVEVVWPSGRAELFEGQPTRRTVTVREGQGRPLDAAAAVPAPVPAPAGPSPTGPPPVPVPPDSPGPAPRICILGLCL